MGHLIANYKSSLNIPPEEYCKVVGHKPRRQGGETYCVNCYATLPEDTKVDQPGRHIFVMRDGKFLEISVDEARSRELDRVRSIEKTPVEDMDKFIQGFEKDAIDARRAVYERMGT